jgi:hypothetical protein
LFPVCQFVEVILEYNGIFVRSNIPHVTRSKTPILQDYILKGYKLTSEASSKYLGVELHSDMSWRSHIDKTVKKANSTLGLMSIKLSKSIWQTMFDHCITLFCFPVIHQSLEFSVNTNIWLVVLCSWYSFLTAEKIIQFFSEKLRDKNKTDNTNFILLEFSRFYLSMTNSFPKFSATDNWCDSRFLHSSFPWQSQMLVHDKFCSTQTQFLLQMDLPPLVSDLDTVGVLSYLTWDLCNRHSILLPIGVMLFY